MNKLYKLIALAGLVLALSSMETFAATTATGNIPLQGAIAKQVDITVTADANASALALETGASGVAIANIKEKCNSKSGYTVTLTSLNAPTGNTLILKGGANPTEQITYTLTYNSTGVTFASGSATLTDGTDKINDTTGKVLAISFSAVAANFTADTYSDTLTITITAK